MVDGEIPTPEFITYTSKDDSGNGSLMRLSPIPVFFSHCYGDKILLDIAMQYAKKSSFTTHPGYIAAEACALMSYIIIHAIHRPYNNENDNDDEEKKNNNDNTDGDKTGCEEKEDVRAFLEDMTSKYLKRIERENNAIKNTLKELIKSKEYNHVKKKVEEMNKKRNKTQSFLQDNDNGDDKMDKMNEDKHMMIAWGKIQEKLNHIHRQIIAQNYIMRLIRSQEPDDSTERCWNWKNKYGELGIDLTMVNRGSNYNGYPNTQGYFGSYCMDGLAMGLHSLYNSTSFGDAVQKAVNMLGDADSTGSIAGQLAGAWYGFTNVFYNYNQQQFLYKQLSKWDDHEFGLRAICLFKIGKQFAQKLKQQIKEKEIENEKMVQELYQSAQQNQNENDDQTNHQQMK